MLDATPEARGRRRLNALHVWLTADRSLRCGTNHFEARVGENGDTWIERPRGEVDIDGVLAADTTSGRDRRYPDGQPRTGRAAL